MQSFYTRYQSIALYPNNEIRFVSRPLVQSKAKRKEDKDFTIPECTKTFLDIELSMSDEAVKSGRACWLPGDASAVTGVGVADLDSTLKFEISEKPKPGYGSIKTKWPSFSARARRQIGLRASAIANVFPKEHQVFITGTLPGSTPEAISTMAAWSSWIMHRVQVWAYQYYSVDADFMPLAYKEKSDERVCYHLAVWEHQKRGALHYHGLIATPVASEILAGSFREFWISLLQQISEATGVDLFARAKGGTWAKQLHKVQVLVQAVKKSVSSYLAKYLSKEASKEESDIDKFPPPARWWACTRAVKKLAQAQTIYLPLPSATAEQSADFLDQTFEFFSDLAPFFCPVINSYSGQTVAALGIFDSNSEALAIFEVLRSHFESSLSENAELIEAIQRFNHSEQWRKSSERAALALSACRRYGFSSYIACLGESYRSTVLSHSQYWQSIFNRQISELEQHKILEPLDNQQLALTL